MHYAGARYYMGALRRWASTDPLKDAFPPHSAYNYGANKPLNLTDPTVMEPVPPELKDQSFSANGSGSRNTRITSTHLDEGGNVIARFDDGDLSVYHHRNGISPARLAVCEAIGNTSCEGAKVGRTLSWNSFEKGNKVNLNRPGHGGRISEA